MSRAVATALFVAIALGGGIAIGWATPPGDWYRALAKPAWTPPGWLFGPVWSLLYVLIGIVGARTWSSRAEPGGATAFALWAAQMALNFAWSPVFFGLRLPAAALVVIALLLASIVALVAKLWGRDRVAALLLLPYAAWVSFATALNASIVTLN